MTMLGTFHILTCPLYIFFCEVSVRIFGPHFKNIFYFLKIPAIFCKLEYKSFIRCVLQYYFPVLAFFFIGLMMFSWRSCLKFNKVNFIFYFLSWIMVLLFYLKTHQQAQGQHIFSYVFF